MCKLLLIIFNLGKLIHFTPQLSDFLTVCGCHVLYSVVAAAAKSLSRGRLCATPWTAAYQAPPSMGFSRRQYWSGVPLPSPSVLLEQRKLVGSAIKCIVKSGTPLRQERGHY